MGSLTRLRVQVCATCGVLGCAVAFLAYTQRGMLILGLALGVAALVALLIWRSRPGVFQPTRDTVPAARLARSLDDTNSR